MSVTRYSEADVPTEYGLVHVVVYREATAKGDLEHLAIINGIVSDESDVVLRVHSECLTGEVLHSLKCDFREQLDLGMKRICAAPRGVILYLRQEGRGIGLGNKIKAYELQNKGYDTVDANTALGFQEDERKYDMVKEIISDLKINSIQLLTNNPVKVEALTAMGIHVTRVSHEVESNDVTATIFAQSENECTISSKTEIFLA